MTIGRYGYDLSLGPNPDFQVEETCVCVFLCLLRPGDQRRPPSSTVRTLAAPPTLGGGAALGPGCSGSGLLPVLCVGTQVGVSGVLPARLTSVPLTDAAQSQTGSVRRSEDSPGRGGAEHGHVHRL